MDNSNKAIAKRINKELKVRGMSQTDLLKSIIRFENPSIGKEKLYYEVMAKKGNFSTSLKGTGNRSISKEQLYIISKIFGVSLEYLWFGDEKKSGFIPKGARYAAYQDNEEEYRTYIASLEYMDKIQYGDEFGYNLFDYFGQFESINGYRFFVRNYNLCFDYENFGTLLYKNEQGNFQPCSLSVNNDNVSYGLIKTLVKYDDVKTFKAIYFGNCSLKRFSPDIYYNSKNYFAEDFLKELLEKENFLELVLKTETVEISQFNKYYAINENRNFLEPMFFEALDYAIKHEEEYHEQLVKILNFAAVYSKSQYEFIKRYLKENSEIERVDVSVDRFASRLLRSSRNSPMGNIIEIKEMTSNERINKLINKIEQYNFNMTHIISGQEKTNEDIKISKPNNQLFLELHNKAIEVKADYVPTISHLTDEFVYFRYYDSSKVNVSNANQLRSIINCINKSQSLVKPIEGKILVHGDMQGQILMTTGGEVVGLAGWQKCHYGNKYEDRVELLSQIDDYSFDTRYLKNYKEVFDVLSDGFNEEEKRILIDKAIELLNKNMDTLLEKNGDHTPDAFKINERISKLEFFRKLVFKK